VTKKLVSMSVYGTDPMYVKGALLNADLVHDVFPGWTLRIYYARAEVDPQPFRDRGCETVAQARSRIHSGMFWRFLAAWDTEAERVIFRDSDSRLNIREAAAVRAWEESGLNAHCMKDHPHHAQLPMLGGMWGIRCGILPTSLLEEVKQMIRRPQRRILDMRWLMNRVHPLIEGSLLRHSSVETSWPSVPFPEHPPYDGFCGQQYDADGNGIWPGGRAKCGR